MKKTNMIDCRDIIRLRFDLGLTHRQIASSTGVASGTVANVLKRVTEAGLGHWPLPKCQSAFNGNPLSASEYDPPPGGWDRWGGVRDPLLLSEVETTALPDLFYADHPRLPFQRCTTKRSFCNQTRWVKLDADFPPSGSSLQAFPHADRPKLTHRSRGAVSTCSESSISRTRSFGIRPAFFPSKKQAKIIPKIGGRQIYDIYTVSIGYRKSYGGFGTFA